MPFLNGKLGIRVLWAFSLIYRSSLSLAEIIVIALVLSSNNFSLLFFVLDE
jgi:hypothetical protein